MRQLIISLGELYRNQSTARLTEWVNQLYARGVASSEHDTVISLHDVNERTVGFSIRDVAEEFGLSFKDLKSNTLVLPVVDRRIDSLQALVELKSSFFKSLLESSASELTFEDSGLIHEGDAYELASSDEHMAFELDPSNQNNDLLAAVVNFSVNGQPGHVLLNAVELENVKKAYINVKFGGLDPLNKTEWDDIFLACVYRRMFSDEAFAGAKALLDDLTAKTWQDAILMHNKFFKRQAEADNLVRDRFGKVIGRTFKKYDAIAIAKSQQDERIVTKPAKSNNVVDINEKRSEKALQSDAECSEVPFDDMEIFDKALAGTLEIDVDPTLQGTPDNMYDSSVEEELEGELWDI